MIPIDSRFHQAPLWIALTLLGAIALWLYRTPSGLWVRFAGEKPEALDSAGYVGGRFICSYLKDAKTQVRIFDRSGKNLGEVPLRGIGTAAGFGGKPDNTETFYSFTGFTRPTTKHAHA